MDDKAIIAAVGLILIHINGHLHGLENALDHQRRFDLGLVHKTIDTIKKCSCFDKNVLGRNGTKLLECVLEIEADAADGNGYFMWMNEETVEEHENINTAMEDEVKLPIPFFGTLHIHRQELQQPVPELDALWTAEPAPTTTTTTQHVA